MKTKKLNLNDLKVESFVTSIEKANVNTIKGGASIAHTVDPKICGGCSPFLSLGTGQDCDKLSVVLPKAI